METLNEKIKRIRTERNVRPADIARFAGIKQSSYASIEKGDTKSISIEVGKGIAKALGMSFNELFEIEVADNSELLFAEIKQLKKRITELEEQLNDKKELLRYYQQSYTVTEKMIILLVDDFWKKGVKGNLTINVSELRNRAIVELEKEYPDLFILKPPFLIKKDLDNTSILFGE